MQQDQFKNSAFEKSSREELLWPWVLFGGVMAVLYGFGGCALWPRHWSLIDAMLEGIVGLVLLAAVALGVAQFAKLRGNLWNIVLPVSKGLLLLSIPCLVPVLVLLLFAGASAHDIGLMIR